MIYLLGDVLAALEVMIAIGQDFGLHDGHDAVLHNRATRKFIYTSFITTNENLLSNAIQYKN